MPCQFNWSEGRHDSPFISHSSIAHTQWTLSGVTLGPFHSLASQSDHIICRTKDFIRSSSNSLKAFPTSQRVYPYHLHICCMRFLPVHRLKLATRRTCACILDRCSHQPSPSCTLGVCNFLDRIMRPDHLTASLRSLVWANSTEYATLVIAFKPITR